MQTRNRMSLIVLGLCSLIALSACKGCDDEEAIPDGTVIIDENISADTTLVNIFVEEAELPDYVVTTSNLQVLAGLTIEPGVRIEFDAGTGFDVSTGSITAIGTAELPIVFTSADELPGSWMGLSVKSSAATNELTHTVVSYGGQDAFPGIDGEVNVGLGAGARLKLTNSTLSFSKGAGLATLLDADLAGFANNTFVDNEGSPVKVEANALHFLDGDSSYSGNGLDVVMITAITLNDDATWAGLDVPIRLEAGGIYEIRAALTLEPGLTVEVSPGTLITVSTGSINASGSTDAPVTFTGVTKTAGAWDLIAIQTDDPNNQFSNCVVEYAGAGAAAGIPEKTAIGLGIGASATISDTTIRDSAGWAVWLQTDAVLTESGNTYENNAGGDVGPAM